MFLHDLHHTGRAYSTNSTVVSNQSPVITSLVANPTTGDAPLTVSFSCEADDLDGSISSYKWDFNGDGITDETTTSGEVSYTYSKPGTYTATVTVVDDEGAYSSKSVTITVTTSSEVLILSYSQGWNLKGTSYDIDIPADNDIATTVWTWRNGEWYVWSGNEQIVNLIQKYGLPFLSDIKAGEGFWVNAKQNAQFEVEIPDSNPTYEFNLNKGWNLLGTSYSLSISSFNKSEVLTVWKWAGNSWQFWSPDPSLMEIAQIYGLAPITEINANEGFWVKTTAPVDISLEKLQ
jgi:PKD repeat protein